LPQLLISLIAAALDFVTPAGDAAAAAAAAAMTSLV
jgi:uncharacterized membrane protein YtjA (UPF0391 family)